MRILVVDDDTAGLSLRKLILERHGHEVITASDPDQARSAFSIPFPDCVVMDLRLPEPADGLALIREFRATAPGVRIVVLSGWSADLDGRREGSMVDQVLAKPVRSELLLNAITRT